MTFQPGGEAVIRLLQSIFSLKRFTFQPCACRFEEQVKKMPAL